MIPRPYNFSGAQDEITLAHLQNAMGLNDHVWSGAAAGWLTGFASKGYLTMGNRLHGDNAPRGWISTLTKQGTDPGDAGTYNAALVSPWNYLNMWTVVSIGAANTCTNAYIKIYDSQLYTLSSSTGAWSRVDNTNGRPYYGMDLYPLDAFSGAVAATRARDVDGRECWNNYSGGVFKLLHNPLTQMIVLADAEDVIGIFATAKAALVGLNGAALNNTPEIMFNIGCDGKYNTDTIGNGVLAGTTYLPGYGSSASIEIPSNGTPVRASFITMAVADTDLSTSSNSGWTDTITNIPYLTEAQVSANLPVLKFNTPA